MNRNLNKKELEKLKQGCGLLLEKPKPEDAVYEEVFGAGEEKPLNWKAYLPKREEQFWVPFCVTFSRLNCAESKAKKEEVEIVNLSDRYLGVVSGTSKSGNSLNQVSEVFRKEGSVLEEECPFTYEMLSGGWGQWNKIFDLSAVRKDARRYKGGNHSWVYSLSAMKNALAFSPIQLGVGVGETWERDVVTKPKVISAYHAITCYHIDDYYYIQDSVGREFKKLDINYPIAMAKSFRDLPLDWKDVKKKMEKTPLKRAIGKQKVYGIKDGEKYWFVSWEDVERWAGYDTLKEAQESVQEVEESQLNFYLSGGIIGNPTFWDFVFGGKTK